MNYTESKTKNRPGGGTVGNPLYHLYTAPQNIDMDYYRDHYMNAEGKEQKIIHFNGDGSVKAFLNNGLTADVTLDANGVYEGRQMQAGTSFFMARR